MKPTLGVRLLRAFTRPPFRDEAGRKGLLEPFSRAQPHAVRHLKVTLPGWPQWRRPLRILFLADLHTGSHSDDLTRLAEIVAEAAAFRPDVVLFGGDYMNMQPFGGGRIPPRAITRVLAALTAPCGSFAVLGNHDYYYDEHEVADALRQHGIIVLADERRSFAYEQSTVNIVGIPDAHVIRAEPRALLASLPDEPTLVLAHDPMWFAYLPAGRHFMLSGHTHGGQIQLPGIGALHNASKAPLRWSHGLVIEGGHHLYVTSGLGTSTLPLRIFCPPEYAVIDVVGAA